MNNTENEIKENINRLQEERKIYGLTCAKEFELIKLRRSIK